MATALKERMEDRRLRLPVGHAALRVDLHAVQRMAGPTGAPRLVAERTEAGHADRFWALALACAAAQIERPDYSLLASAARAETARLAALEPTSRGWGSVRSVAHGY